MATHSRILAWEIPWRSLGGYSPWGHKESDMTKRLSMHAQETNRALRNHFPCVPFPLFFKCPASQMTAAHLSDHVAVHSFAV